MWGKYLQKLKFFEFHSILNLLSSLQNAVLHPECILTSISGIHWYSTCHQRSKSEAVSAFQQLFLDFTPFHSHLGLLNQCAMFHYREVKCHILLKLHKTFQDGSVEMNNTHCLTITNKSFKKNKKNKNWADCKNSVEWIQKLKCVKPSTAQLLSFVKIVHKEQEMFKIIWILFELLRIFENLFGIFCRPL